MHETIICNNIIEEAKKHGNISSITLSIGDLAALTADQLKHTLSVMIDWDIIINKEDSFVKCRCGYQGKPTILDRAHEYCIIECPKCKRQPEILKGDQIKITNVVVQP